MRLLVALLTLTLLGTSLVPILDDFVTPVEADSLPSWNRIFHLHDGATYSPGLYDWMNSSGPANPGYTDYDGDGREGISIKKSGPVPADKAHAWYLYPSVKSSVQLIGDILVQVWAKSQDNNSGIIVLASFYDVVESQFSDPAGSGTLIGQASSPIPGPLYDEWNLVNISIPSASYMLPAGHHLCLLIERGDSIASDLMLVYYDKDDRDSTVTLTTSNFISMDDAWLEDLSGTERSSFSEFEIIMVFANVSDPYGAADILGAEVTVKFAGNQTVVVSKQSMSLSGVDPSSIPYWKMFETPLPMLGAGSYVANVSARDSDGYPSWLNVSFSIVAIDHFRVVVPSSITAGSMFPVNLTAQDSSDQTVTEWVGTVTLRAYRWDKILLANGTLSKTTIVFNSSDYGQVNISDETYNYSEEQMYIRASSGPRLGWSGPISVRSGPVTLVEVEPSEDQDLTAGDFQVFTAHGYDSLNNENTSWTPFWNATPAGVGTLTPLGLSAVFQAVGSGSGTITSTNNLTGASANVSVTVVPGNLARINISAPSYPIVVHEGESIALTATGYDAMNNTVSISGASWDTTTSGTMAGLGTSATFYAGYVPERGIVECRLGSVVGTIEVEVVNSVWGPWFNPIPAQIWNEDEGTWDLSLAGHWQDVNGTTGLFWWAEDINYSLYFILRDPDYASTMQFYTQPNQWGEDQFTLWVVDTDGYRSYRNVTVRILPINDKPTFVNHPPTELFVTFDTEYTFDYTYYVDDVDNPMDQLSLHSDGSPNIWFESLVGHFNYSGKSSYFKIVKMWVQDYPGAISEMSVVVKVTKDIPPSLNTSLPDLLIEEGEEDYFAFDLDDYFYDLDGSVLIYSTGFENIPAPFINITTHRVYFSTPGEWSGVTQGTFTARDPEGALKVDTISVTVIAVNDRPVINPIAPIYVRYAQVYYLYLSPYVYDPDDQMEFLTFEINDTHVVRGVSMTGADRLEILYPANLSNSSDPVFANPYHVKVSMNVTDPWSETAYVEFEVYVTDNRPPEVVAENPDQLYFTFPEDTFFNDTLYLYDIIYDPDDLYLTFTIESTESNVHFVIESTGYVSLSASENWSGMSTLDVVGMDDSNAWAFVQILVVVTPVNDAPIVKRAPEDSIVTGGSRNSRYPVSEIFYDSDNLDLSLMATPEVTAQVIGNWLYVSLPSGSDVITVTLQASDGELTSPVIMFEVGVRKTIADKIGYPYTLPFVLLAAGVAGYFAGSRLPRPYVLENLFLIHNDGRLVTHVTKEENTNLDKDVVSAMFTAVQEFVRDSFQKGEVGLKKLEIGDKNVMIEKGKSAYLALIYSGWPQKEVFDMLPVLLRDIEERYKGKLEKWNGTMKAVPGIEKMLQDYMVKGFKPGAWQEEAEIAEEEWVDILNKET